MAMRENTVLAITINSSADAIQPTKAEVIEMLGKTLEKLNQNVNLSKSKLQR